MINLRINRIVCLTQRSSDSDSDRTFYICFPHSPKSDDKSRLPAHSMTPFFHPTLCATLQIIIGCVFRQNIFKNDARQNVIFECLIWLWQLFVRNSYPIFSKNQASKYRRKKISSDQFQDSRHHRFRWWWVQVYKLPEADLMTVWNTNDNIKIIIIYIIIKIVHCNIFYTNNVK